MKDKKRWRDFQYEDEELNRKDLLVKKPRKQKPKVKKFKYKDL